MICATLVVQTALAGVIQLPWQFHLPQCPRPDPICTVDAQPLQAGRMAILQCWGRLQHGGYQNVLQLSGICVDSTFGAAAPVRSRA